MAAYDQSEETAAGELFDLHYDRLIAIARERRRRGGASETLRTADLLHEAFLRMDTDRSYADVQHFLRSAALAMRHVVIDYARKRLTARRGKGQRPLPIQDNEDLAEFSETPEQIVAISELLSSLEEQNPRWLRIVDARYFAGMTEVETAELLGVTDRTVRRDWTAAGEWLAERLDAA